MNILGIDPGVTTGWCIYNTVSRAVISHGQFETWLSERLRLPHHHVAVIERPQGYGVTRPQMVDCGYITGRLVERFPGAHELTRREVKRILTEATQRDVVVTDDATAWAALKLLHGEGCDKKGGALHGVRAHERAALAVAVAFALRQAKPAGVAL
jgi:hypothetical protein